ASHELVDGNTWRQVVEKLPNGQQVAAKLNFDAWNSVGIQADEKNGEPIFGQSPTAEQTKKRDSFIQNNLVPLFAESGHLYDLVGGWTKEVYTDQPGMPGTGHRYFKSADPIVGISAQGNQLRDQRSSHSET